MQDPEGSPWAQQEGRRRRHESTCAHSPPSLLLPAKQSARLTWMERRWCSTLFSACGVTCTDMMSTTSLQAGRRGVASARCSLVRPHPAHIRELAVSQAAARPAPGEGGAALTLRCRRRAQPRAARGAPCGPAPAQSAGTRSQHCLCDDLALPAERTSPAHALAREQSHHANGCVTRLRGELLQLAAHLHAHLADGGVPGEVLEVLGQRVHVRAQRARHRTAVAEASGSARQARASLAAPLRPSGAVHADVRRVTKEARLLLLLQDEPGALALRSRHAAETCEACWRAVVCASRGLRARC